MTSQKKRNRARRRVERMVDEAWEALARKEHALARKLSQRAVEQGHVNPRVWLERGRIARELGDDEEAEAAFRQAIARAENFGAAFAELARLQGAHGKLAAAERLMRRAVELVPDEADWRREHAAWAAEVGPQEEQVVELQRPVAVLGGRTAEVDWSLVETELRGTGCARLGELVDRQECSVWLRTLHAGDALGHAIERDSTSDRHTMWFVDRPPEALAGLAAELVARCTSVADAVFAPLGRPSLAAGATCALVEQGEGGVTGPTRPTEKGAFPLRVELALEGVLDLVMIDLRPGRKVRRQVTRFRAGEALVVATAERLVRVGGVDGLQAIASGVEGSGSRLAVTFGEDR